jgi:glycosyltransferase involved in cell wall biosynthesis
MKVLIIGQCQGGNAKSWQNFLMGYTGFEVVHYVCRNQCQQDFFLKGEGKKVFRFYNRFARMGLLRKIWVKLVSTRILPAFVRRMDAKYHYDIIHFQGNYEPEFNMRLIKATKAKPVISIYGSDFYQRYLKGGPAAKKSFERVIDRAEHILFNFERTREDFLKEIDVSAKSSVGCMGVNDYWAEPPLAKSNAIKGITRFLSARALYTYNNVDYLVDAFIELYANNPEYELYLLNGYGWDEPVKNDILEKVKDVTNIHTKVGEWITDEELKGYYDLCDYSFCIGSTDQLSANIIYGYMHKTINILSPLANYAELDKLKFKTHHFLKEVTTDSLKHILANLPQKNEEAMEADRKLAQQSFLFSNRFENTKEVFDSLVN